MFGVVIWSDPDEGKAVIWCEDHGDLAFCRHERYIPPLHLDAGDLVQFELLLENCQRIARNPRLVAEGVYDGITGQLVAAHPEAKAQLTPGRVEKHATSFDAVVQLDSYRDKHKKQTLSEKKKAASR